MDVSDDGYLSLMDDAGNTRDDLKLPEGDLANEIKSAYDDGRDILVSLHTFCRLNLRFDCIFLQNSAQFWAHVVKSVSLLRKSTLPSTSKLQSLRKINARWGKRRRSDGTFFYQ